VPETARGDGGGAGGPSGDTISVGELVSELDALLRDAGVAESRKEARDIVAAMLDMPRFWPSAHPDEPLDDDIGRAARRAAEKRAGGAPFAYAVGRAAFRHLTLDVDERVLIPRQETEVLVESVLDWANASAPASGGTAIDIGTGSGAIALALASEGKFERVVATDICLGALAVARANVSRLRAALRAPVELRHGSLLAPVRGERARVIVANPPYIACGEAPSLPASVRDWEPPIALFCGEDGMSTTRRIIHGAGDVLEPGGLLAIEVDARRASLAAETALADGRYAGVRVELDLSGRERILLATRKGQ
jgi:release factor glutamine methyltransferase